MPGSKYTQINYNKFKINVKQENMNYQSLYQQFKWKQFHEKQLQENQNARIQQLSNQPKINMNSTSILLKRTIQILDQFEDQDLVNLETSIPILRAVGILQLLKSVEEVKNKLGDQGDPIDSRLRHQAQFLYHFWNLIDEEEVQCRQIKELVQLLQTKKKNELKFVLSQIYNDEERVENVVRSWTILSANQQYYKHIGKTGPIKSQSNKQNSGSHLQQSLYRSKLDRSGELGSPIYETKSGNKSKLLMGQKQKQDKVLPNQFTYTCQLSSSQEKQLINRLYQIDRYKEREELKKQKEEQKQKQQLRQCTFKPSLIKRGKSVNSTNYNQIRGYDKAINRLKAGNQKNKTIKQLRQYKPVGENYEKLKQKGINPPRFLERKKKEEQRILFIISFDLGRHKTNVKIRQNDTEDSVAERICKIYSLKKEFYEEIKQIVRSQLEAYYAEMHQNQQLATQQIF